jgi:hypothetical protein
MGQDTLAACSEIIAADSRGLEEGRQSLGGADDCGRTRTPGLTRSCCRPWSRQRRSGRPAMVGGVSGHALDDAGSCQGAASQGKASARGALLHWRACGRLS